MPTTYERTPLSHNLHRERQYSVPLRGVPQIPPDVHQLCSHGLEFLLTQEQIERSAAAIREATLEIRRRHEAKLQHVNLAEYFGGESLDSDHDFDPAARDLD